MNNIKDNTPPQKILVVCQHFWPETFRVSDISAGLVEKGYTVDVLCGIPNYPAGKFFGGYGYLKNRRQNYKGVNVIRVPEIPRGNNSNLRIFINFISFPFFALFYIPLLATKKYDRILVYGLSPVFMAFPAIILSKIFRIKLFIYVMDFWPHSLFSIMNFQNTFIRSAITKMSYWHYKRADGLPAVYKGIQNRLVTDVGIDKDKTIYIPQAPEKIYEKDVPNKALAKRFAGKFNIVFAGNINPAQSFETILSAAKMLSDSGVVNFRFIILGEGMSKKWLLEEVSRLNLEEHFVFEGLLPVEEVPKYHTIADALILALTRDPLFEYATPAKIQSYLAAGRPILGAMDGEGQRIINQSGSGICVDSGDDKALYGAMSKLVSMPEAQRAKMGAAGREYHFKYYERDYNLNRLIEFVFNGTNIQDTEYEN